MSQKKLSEKLSEKLSTKSPATAFKKILLTCEQISDIVKKLAERLDKDYAERSKKEGIVLIGILKGSYIFLSDLSRALKIDHNVDFMRVSSYSGTNSTGNLKIECDVRDSIFRKHVIIVEDIIDSGLTLSKLVEVLKTRHPASLECCTLLSKPTERKVDVDVKYTGHELIPPEFAVGYGLDYNEHFRNLPYIAVPSDEMIEHYNHIDSVGLGAVRPADSIDRLCSTEEQNTTATTTTTTTSVDDTSVDNDNTANNANVNVINNASDCERCASCASKGHHNQNKVELAVDRWCRRYIGVNISWRGSIPHDVPIAGYPGGVTNRQGVLLYQDATSCSASHAFADVYKLEDGTYDIYMDSGSAKYHGHDYPSTIQKTNHKSLCEVVNYLANFAGHDPNNSGDLFKYLQTFREEWDDNVVTTEWFRGVVPVLSECKSCPKLAHLIDSYENHDDQYKRY